MSLFWPIMLSLLWIIHCCCWSVIVLAVRAMSRMQNQIEELNRRLDALTDDMK